MSEPATYKKLPQEICSLRRRGRGDGTCKERQRRSSEGKSRASHNSPSCRRNCRQTAPKRSLAFWGLKSNKKAKQAKRACLAMWSRRRDLNPRPLAPEASALPNCATPRRPTNKSLTQNCVDVKFFKPSVVIFFNV